jgi:hypothetical protein
LVTVVAQRVGGRASALQLTLLRNMLLLALLIVLASLAPHVPFRLGLSEYAAWRVAGIGFFLGWLAYVAAVVPSAYRYVRDINPREGLLWFPHLALHVAAGGSLLAVVLGLWEKAAPGLYSLALFIVLYMAAYLLLRNLSTPMRHCISQFSEQFLLSLMFRVD